MRHIHMKKERYLVYHWIVQISIFTLLVPAVSTTSLANEVGALEEVVVTARRREENIQDVPDVITAFSEQSIEDAGIVTIDDAIALTPNIDIRNDQQPGVFTMTVRGVSTVRNGQPPVAFVVDGVTLPSSNAFTQYLFDVERIEIMKGPQGALYGRNSIGGAINIVTKQPTNDFEGRFKAGIGKGDDYLLQGSISGPVAKDKLLFRVSGMYRNRNGLLDNKFLGTNADWGETAAVRGKLLWTPHSNLKLDLRASYYESDQGSAYYVPLGIATPLGPTLPLNTTTGTIQGDKPGVADVGSWDTSLKIDWDTSQGTFTSISSYNELRETNDQEIDWTPSSFLEGLLLTDTKGFTQELRFTSPSDQRFRWFVGTFYQSINRIRGTNAFINANAFTGNLDPAQKFLVPVANERLNQDWRSYAVFGQLNYDILENLELTVAVRFDRFTTREVQNIFGSARPELKNTFDDIQPKFSLAYSLNDDLMTYVTIARGWRPGGFALPNVLGITKYDQETLWNYEIGFKSSLFNNRLRFNAAGFYIDYSKQQFFLLTSNAGGGPVQLIINGKKSEITGFDLELIAKPTDRLDLIVGLGVVDSKLDSIGSEVTTPFPLVFSGNKLPNTANDTVNVSAQYTMPVQGRFELIGRVDYSRVGKTYWTLDNILSEKPYNLVNLRLSLAWDRWRITGVVNNVFNEDYFTQVFDQRWSGFVTDVGWPSQPRFFGVEFSAIF